MSNCLPIVASFCCCLREQLRLSIDDYTRQLRSKEQNHVAYANNLKTMLDNYQRYDKDSRIKIRALLADLLNDHKSGLFNLADDDDIPELCAPPNSRMDVLRPPPLQRQTNKLDE